jgi:hypothetical protein
MDDSQKNAVTEKVSKKTIVTPPRAVRSRAISSIHRGPMGFCELPGSRIASKTSRSMFPVTPRTTARDKL